MGPKWLFLLMYRSHDMRHTGFPQVDCGQRDPRDSGRHNCSMHIYEYVEPRSIKACISML